MLDAVPGTAAVHLCFGNYGGQTIQEGSWDQLLQYLNALHADHVVLECAHRPPEELLAFKDLYDAGGVPAQELPAFLVGIAVSALTGCAVIGGLLRYLSSNSLRFFVAYRIIFGILVLALAFFRQTAG